MSIQAIASEFLQSPARVTVGSEELSANHRVKQIVEVVDGAVKDRRLIEMLKKYHDGSNRIIIFALYKKEADRIHQLVERSTSFKVNAIHGDRSQETRSAAMEAFKSGKCPLLIATDVAARGLDIPDVVFVVNYTCPPPPPPRLPAENQARPVQRCWRSEGRAGD